MSPAVAQVNAQIAAIQAEYEAIRREYEQQLQQQVAQQQARAQYLSQALAPIAGNIQDIVGKQTGASTQFAQGFSDTVKQLAGSSADAANADLAKMGMPGHVDSHGTEASDALYGTYGFVPATTLSQAGTAQAAAAALLPATALRQGEQQIAGLYSDFNGPNGPLADIRAKELDLIAQRPQMIAEARAARRKDAADLYSAGLISQREFAKRMGVKDWRKFSNQVGGGPAHPKASATLSKALGYLVDETGAPILNAKGKPIALPRDAGKLERFGSASSGYWAWDPQTGEITNLLPPQPKQPKTYAPKGYQLKTLKDGSTAVFDPNTGTTQVIAPPPKGSTKAKFTASQQARYRAEALTFAENAFKGVTDKDGTQHPPLSLSQALQEVQKTGVPWSIAKNVVYRYYKQHTYGPVPPPGYYSGKGKPARGGRQGVSATGVSYVLPTHWTGTHETDNLGWGTKSAEDIFPGPPGTSVGAPEAGIVLYFHPEGAQGGGSMMFRANSGRIYWIGHIANGVAAGTRLRRGQYIAQVAAQNVSVPHVHIDARGGVV